VEPALQSPDADRFISHSADVLTVHDLTGAVTYASPAAAEVLGHDPCDLVGRQLMELVHPDDRATVGSARDRIAHGREVRFECRIRRADGEHRWVESSFRLVRDDAGEPLEVHATTRDVSARKLADQRFELAFRHAPIGMAVVALDGSFVATNPALETMLGRSGEDLQRCTFQDLTHPDDLAADLELLGECLAVARHGYSMDKRYLRPDGTVVWATLAVVLVRDAGGEPLSFISQVVDISERKALEERLSVAASTDPLTGLANRAAATERLAALAASPSGPSFGLCFCDVRGFKAVNDRHGHRVGDEVLQTVAARLGSAVRSSDLVARWGGDEFLVILSPLSGAAELAQAADRLVRVSSDPVRLGGAPVEVHVDVGTHLVAPGERWDLVGMVDRADREMYRSRAAQRT
jgi:diguanylate cyclase (GGDEF)-like protein/PAS domain S-box-containing protein